MSNELKKYEKARRLGKVIEKIRQEYHNDWKSEDDEIKQRGVALYFIDAFLLRVGNEKGPNEADTVGCCSLRTEHINLPSTNIVKFDFFGKASIHYDKQFTVDPAVYENLKTFKSHKTKLFDKLSSIFLNKYLKTKMDGLTTKVFRTFNASTRFEQYLEEFTKPEQTTRQKIASYNKKKKIANECNHKSGKEVNVTTTKENYLDPRITYAWFVILNSLFKIITNLLNN